MFKETSSESSQQNYGVKLIFKKKIVSFSIFLSIFMTGLFCQNYNIDYFGVVSTEIDSNMAKMTSDLYYTQLNEINNFSVVDKRDGSLLETEPDPSLFSSSNLSFYTVIQKDSKSDSWITIYHVVDKLKNEEHTKRKTYDSFYKILMESKNILKETIKNLIENDSAPESIQMISNSTDAFAKKNNTIVSTEALSGTWAGEENINKIVILRGGRGFIIFNNGASMNVSISLSSDSPGEIIIAQNGKANASFYPELPRSIALKAALSAAPIKWVLTMSEANILKGKKETLLPEDDGENYKIGTLPVEWQKVN